MHLAIACACVMSVLITGQIKPGQTISKPVPAIDPEKRELWQVRDAEHAIGVATQVLGEHFVLPQEAAVSARVVQERRDVLPWIAPQFESSLWRVEIESTGLALRTLDTSVKRNASKLILNAKAKVKLDLVPRRVSCYVDPRDATVLLVHIVRLDREPRVLWQRPNIESATTEVVHDGGERATVAEYSPELGALHDALSLLNTSSHLVVDAFEIDAYPLSWARGDASPQPVWSIHAYDLPDASADGPVYPQVPQQHRFIVNCSSQRIVDQLTVPRAVAAPVNPPDQPAATTGTAEAGGK